MKKNIFLFMLAAVLCMLPGCGRDTLDISTISDNTVSETEKGKTDSKERTDSEEHEDEELCTEAEAGMSELCVYVCGAVVNEGVYYLPAGSIKMDALQAAGGYMEDAASGYVNLAEPAADGEKIYFPFQEETEAFDSAPYETEEIPQKQKLVNINTASKEELMTLPGIGESKALAIIKYREENQGFQSTDEIMNINGIKEGVYHNIKDLITI